MRTTKGKSKGSGVTGHVTPGHVTQASPAAHTGRRRPLAPRGTSGAGRAKPGCQCAGFPGPFVSRRVGTAAGGFGQSDAVSR